MTFVIRELVTVCPPPAEVEEPELIRFSPIPGSSLGRLGLGLLGGQLPPSCPLPCGDDNVCLGFFLFDLLRQGEYPG